MANNYGITGSGFIVPTLEDVEFEVQNAMQSALPSLSFGQGKVETALSRVMANQLYCAWQAINRNYNQSNPNFVSGCQLNALAARNRVYRIEGETDQELRVRLNSVIDGLSENLTGSSCFNNLFNTLSALSGVSDIQINLNEESEQVGFLPPNSYEVIITGGDSNEIASAIWDNHPVGITLAGNTVSQITDCTGVCRDIPFTRPKFVPIYLDIRVERTGTICGCPTDDTTVLCQVVFDYISEVNGACFTRIGQPLNVQDFFSPIYNVQGLNITCALMSRDGLTADQTQLTFKRDEVPFFNKDCINIEFSSEEASPCTTGVYNTPPAECTFSMDVVKEANVTEFTTVGQTITYTYTVTNTTNNVIVDDIVVIDDRATVTCGVIPSGGLPAGDSITCTATYVTTFQDAINGFVENNAQAQAGTLLSPTVSLNIPYTGDVLFHAMNLEKRLVSGSCNAVGAALTYQYIITNTGTVPISSQPIITDDRIGGIICPPIPTGGLLPGGSISVTADSVVTQQDIDAGELCNTARAVATSIIGSVVSNSAQVCIDCADSGGVDLPPTAPDDVLINDCVNDVPFTTDVWTDDAGAVSLSDNGTAAGTGLTFIDNGNNTGTLSGAVSNNGVITITGTDSTNQTSTQTITINCSVASGVIQNDPNAMLLTLNTNNITPPDETFLRMNGDGTFLFESQDGNFLFNDASGSWVAPTSSATSWDYYFDTSGVSSLVFSGGNAVPNTWFAGDDSFRELGFETNVASSGLDTVVIWFRPQGSNLNPNDTGTVSWSVIIASNS